MTEIQIKETKINKEIQKDSALFFPETENIYIVIEDKGLYNLIQINTISNKTSTYFTSWQTFNELVKHINEGMQNFQVIKNISLDLEF